MFVSILCVLPSLRSVTAQTPTYNAKTMPASACTLESTDPGTTYELSDGGIAVFAGGATFSCPIVRDNPAATNGMPLIQLMASDTSSTTETKCWAVEYSMTSGALFNSAQAATGVAFSSGLKQLQIFPPQSHANGVTAIHCYVPAGNGLGGYLYRENNPTTND